MWATDLRRWEVATWHIQNPISPNSLYIWTGSYLCTLESGGQEVFMETGPKGLFTLGVKA